MDNTIETIDVKYLQKASRLSLYRVSPEVKEIIPGQHFHLNEEQEWEYADGTKRSYPTLNIRKPLMKYGLQGELLEGRDDVSGTGLIACLITNFEIGTHAYDKDETYEYGAALAVDEGGIIVPFDSGKHKPEFVIGYVTGVPDTEEDVLTYQG